MFQVIKYHLSTPGAEKQPIPWLDRLVAHFGVGVLLTVLAFPVAILLSSLGKPVGMIPACAAIMASGFYACIEVYEVWGKRPSRALLWDCVLDWVGVSHGCLVVYAVSQGFWKLALCVVLSGTIVAYAGFKTRLKNHTGSTGLA